MLKVVASRHRVAWVNGLAHWAQDGTAYLSIAFTWRLNEARMLASHYRSLGYRIRAGGPATFRPYGYLADVAELGGEIRDAITRHNPNATIASRGCPENCSFCIVPKLWGTAFTLIPNFVPRPILCDDNLSALPVHYQNHIIERYLVAGVALIDANSGFAPRAFDGGTYERWSRILRGPWRFGYDEIKEREEVRTMMELLRSRSVTPRKMQVYCMIGNEPVADCLERIYEIIRWGGEPYTQRQMKLNALKKEPWVKHDWTEELLARVARYGARRGWRGPGGTLRRFEEYDPSAKSRPRAAKSQWQLFP